MMLTGLNSNTAQNLQLGAGAILKNKYVQGTAINDAWKKENVLTATNGGITFSAVPNFFTPAIDGANENIADLKFITSYTVTLSFTATDVNAEVITKALGCADVSGSVIKGKNKVTLSDFNDLYFIGEKNNGEIVQITIKNAMNTSGLTLTTANEGNGGIAFTFTGHYKLEDLETAPFEIETIA